MTKPAQTDDDLIHDLTLLEAAIDLLPNNTDSDKALAVLQALHERLRVKPGPTSSD